MNTLTLNTKARTYAVALVSIVLLAASGPVLATQADGQQLACQGSTSCGG